MNEFEENIYKEIKDELVQSKIDKKMDTYFTNKNELTHYYNVGKMIVDAQGGEEKAEYGDGLIKKISNRLTNELGKGYSVTSLKYMRKFFVLQKSQHLADQSLFNITWSHLQQLLSIKDKLVQSKIDKKVDTYFTNRNELTNYYNVGKMIVDAQGGEDKAQYGNELIKKLS